MKAVCFVAVSSRKGSTVSRRRTIRKRDSGDLPRHLTPSEIRAKCIEEILNTEKIYVQHLQDIVEVSPNFQCKQVTVNFLGLLVSLSTTQPAVFGRTS